MHFLPKEKGFTLVELLIVVVIIAVLSAVGMAVFGSQQPKSRDARRKADINAIADAMEANYDKEDSPGKYSSLAVSFFSNTQIPTDPLDGKSTACNGNYCEYCYTEGTTAQSAVTCTTSNKIDITNKPGGGNDGYWIVCANLEVDDSGPGGQDYYCRQNRQ